MISAVPTTSSSTFRFFGERCLQIDINKYSILKRKHCGNLYKMDRNEVISLLTKAKTDNERLASLLLVFIII